MGGGAGRRGRGRDPCARGAPGQLIHIAARLYLSTHTVRTHIQRAMMKLHARDRAQLVVIAYKSGLVHPSPSRHETFGP
jgi:Bacterial regulatory proteins, luxR family